MPEQDVTSMVRVNKCISITRFFGGDGISVGMSLPFVSRSELQAEVLTFGITGIGSIVSNFILDLLGRFR